MPRRKTRKGGYYAFDGAIAPGAANWTRNTEVPVLGGKRRKHKKSRKTRRHRKGGTRFGAVSASYAGTGSRGIADYVATDTKGPYVNGSSALGAFNNFGAKPMK